MVMLYRWFPSVLKAITIIRPETLVRWHRAGFRGYWRWKSRSLGGRPRIAADLRPLIRRMSARVCGNRASKTLKKEGAWVKEQKVVVKNGKITEYRVDSRSPSF